MSLAVIGGTVVDIVLPRVPRLPVWPRHTESTLANLVLLREPPIVTLGGNGANAAYVAARCGTKVTLHTQLAADTTGELARGWLERAGCRVVCARAQGTLATKVSAKRVSGARNAASKSATAMNVTAANARQQRAMFFFPGAAVEMQTFADVLNGDEIGRRFLLVTGWPHPPLAEMAQGLRAARTREMFTAVDAGPILGRPWSLSALRPVFASLDLFLTNDYELCRIARTATCEAAIAKLRLVYSGHLVIKRGGDGAQWIPKETSEVVSVGSRRVRVVNTVGAGDSFNGALMAALDRGADFPRAMREACATAASVVASKHGVLGVQPRSEHRVPAPAPTPNSSQPKTHSHENLAGQC
ncbi:MAG TPA: carbohydrate kinase family protein [Opitutaceae bacterium]|nr:carbohydrate kinase family protein [Opitutaceae bacterium]